DLCRSSSGTEDGAAPMLSVVVPVYNEESRLSSGLDRIIAWLAARDDRFEVLVVNDGSRDATGAMAERRSSEDPRVRCVSLPQYRGKGAAVARGMTVARGRWILCTDIDLSTPIEELARLEALR